MPVLNLFNNLLIKFTLAILSIAATATGSGIIHIFTYIPGHIPIDLLLLCNFLALIHHLVPLLAILELRLQLDWLE